MPNDAWENLHSMVRPDITTETLDVPRVLSPLTPGDKVLIPEDFKLKSLRGNEAFFIGKTSYNNFAFVSDSWGRKLPARKRIPSAFLRETLQEDFGFPWSEDFTVYIFEKNLFAGFKIQAQERNRLSTSGLCAFLNKHDGVEFVPPTKTKTLINPVRMIWESPFEIAIDVRGQYSIDTVGRYR
jgi:hypothetical protein